MAEGQADADGQRPVVQFVRPDRLTRSPESAERRVTEQQTGNGGAERAGSIGRNDIAGTRRSPALRDDVKEPHHGSNAIVRRHRAKARCAGGIAADADFKYRSAACRNGA
jgi:hypothetical protein